MRSEPYKLFFPLGVLLALAGVGQWVLHAVGWVDDYRPLFHATTQVQGFLSAFAAGFVFTAMPRRTQSAPAAPWQLVATAAGLIGVPISGWLHLWVVGQLSWLVAATVLLGFVSVRLLPRFARRRPPNSFVWLAPAWLCGIAGAIVMMLAGVGPNATSWALPLGRGPLFQGMFLSLAIGVGGLVFPLMTRGVPAADAAAGAAGRRARLGHGLAIAILAGSFLVEAWVSVRAGLAVRAVIVVLVLVVSAELWRLPTQPGWNRWLLWNAGWAIPAGLVVGCVLPEQYRAGLHITFIGGFALLVLAVGAQVTLGHQGYEADKRGRPWQLLGIGSLVTAAVLFRCCVDFDPARFFWWLGSGAVAFVLACVVWLAYLLPKILRPENSRR